MTPAHLWRVGLARLLGTRAPLHHVPHSRLVNRREDIMAAHREAWYAGDLVRADRLRAYADVVDAEILHRELATTCPEGVR